MSVCALQVLAELRKKREAEQEDVLVCEVNPDEALIMYRKALESSMTQPSAAHPVEAYGTDGLSLASSRRKVLTLLFSCRVNNFLLLTEQKP
jgi:hypothetical protein